MHILKIIYVFVTRSSQTKLEQLNQSSLEALYQFVEIDIVPTLRELFRQNNFDQLIENGYINNFVKQSLSILQNMTS